MKATWILGVWLAGTAPGVWAQRPAPAVPIIDNSGMLLGASRAGKWISAEKIRPALKQGDKYRFYTLQGYAHTLAGGKPELSEASGAAYYIPFPQHPSPESDDTIGVGGSWNAMPRPTHAESTKQTVYLDAVKTMLASKGLAGVQPNITRIVRVDLFGKGQDAVLIEAKSPNYKLSTGFENDPPVPNTYSCVLLRMVVNGSVKTTVLGGAFYKKNGAKGPVEEYRIVNILDLNGDGVMEIVVSSHYYEGASEAVFEVKSGVPKQVLEAGDGA